MGERDREDRGPGRGGSLLGWALAAVALAVAIALIVIGAARLA